MAEYYLVSAAQGPQGIQGIQGEVGANAVLAGAVLSISELPSVGNTLGTLYIDKSTGIGWLWTGSSFEDVGMLRGPQGEVGTILWATRSW